MVLRTNEGGTMGNVVHLLFTPAYLLFPPAQLLFPPVQLLFPPAHLFFPPAHLLFPPAHLFLPLLWKFSHSSQMYTTTQSPNSAMPWMWLDLVVLSQMDRWDSKWAAGNWMLKSALHMAGRGIL